ncbi:hypothetical protein BC941DRAFT_414055 [Chlamydoabsidia padenii]|nr:hypothetical protein BC941DRAFT_414055 [Chlamydoabsidia padenii]
MTTISTSSTQQQSPVTSNTINNNDNVNKPLKQQYKLPSNSFTVQRPSLGLHQNCGLSNMESPYYTTARQQIRKTCVDDMVTSFENGIGALGQSITADNNTLTDDYDEDDEDDVEIIMHDDHHHHTKLSSACTSSSLTDDSTIDVSSLTTSIPLQQQEQRQSNMDLPEVQIDYPLQRQLEYYFSRQNLANDSYLVSQMDPDLYVPIATIANFKRVLELTSDMDHIVETLRCSSVVTVDDSGTKVKPNVSMQRTTLILRDVPDATKDEIHQFLQDVNSSLPIINIKNEYADMWYITFKSEEDALKMMYDTRGKLFKGQYMAARMKSEPVVGSLQARKSALQAGSSSSQGQTHFNYGQHTYNHHSNMNMKTYIYNGHYYPHNAQTSYATANSLRHPDSTYSHNIPSGTHRNGRYMNNQSNSNNNNNRRSTNGARGWYKNNNVNNYSGAGGNNTTQMRYTGRQSSSSDPQAYTTSSKIQQSQQFRHTRINEQSNSVSHASTNDIQPSNTHRQNHYNRPFNHHRGHRNGRSSQSTTQWQQQEQHKNYSTRHQPHLGSIESTYSTQHNGVSSITKYNSTTLLSASPSPAPSLDNKYQTPIPSNSVGIDKHSGSETASPITGHIATITITSTPSASASSTMTTYQSGKEQSNNEYQKETTRNRKSKWDKKKKNRNSLAKEHKRQEQPDLNSGTFFPPLPGTRNHVDDIDPDTTPSSLDISSTAEKEASKMEKSVLLEKRLSIADIVKRGYESTRTQSPRPLPNGDHLSGTTNTKSNTTATIHQKKSLKTTLPQYNQSAKKPVQTKTITSQKEELFPLLCPIQESPASSSSFSYADMLKKSDGDDN